ncbi:MAG: hypothetical protein MJE66_15560 [Proteobacteria bacterium]|nr:hypothetical protein [Pseudomonadota bacterium]
MTPQRLVRFAVVSGLLAIGTVLLEWPRVALALAHVAAVSWCAAQRRVREVFAALPASQRRIVAGMLGAVLAGHIAQDARATFPFIDWRMYSHTPADPINVLRIEGVGADGSVSRVELLPLFWLHSGRVGLPVLVEARSALDPHRDPSKRRKHRDRFEQLLRFVARRHNETYPSQTIESIRVRIAPQPVVGPRVEDEAAFRTAADLRLENAP